MARSAQELCFLCSDCLVEVPVKFLLAIEYVVTGVYPAGLSKNKKRAVRRTAGTLISEKGDMFIQHTNREECSYM